VTLKEECENELKEPTIMWSVRHC